MRRRLVPLLLIIGGTVAACVALELLMQAAAIAVRLTRPSQSRSWEHDGHRRVLCVGDSSTYGLYMTDRADAYPQKLEQLWNASGKQPPIEVLNLGYPGTNSSRLRQNLRPMLEEIRPAVVIVMIGTNDYWTLRVPVDAARSRIGAAWDYVRLHSRLYRAVHLTVRGIDRRQLEMPNQREISDNPERTVRYGDTEFSFGYERAHRQADHDEQLVANLLAMADDIRAFGAYPIFLTYPSGAFNYGDGGRLTRIAAEVGSVPLIDMEEVFLPLCPKEPCPTLLLKDHHPTAEGYRLMAQTLVDRNLEAAPPVSLMGPPRRRSLFR